MIPSVYNPKVTEEKWYNFWERGNLFHAKPKSDKKPYCIVIPPPNITGILHMGHALNNTIQDILIRYKRMKGFEALWMPGTDHAGIATQNVVEKELAKEGLKRQAIGREKFLERVWLWKEEYGSTIIKQLKRLGCSCDWERTRFTMDEEYSKSVVEVFVHLYEKGLIYRGNYIINWCPRCQTALSDEEAPHRTLEGNLYYIRYPLKEVTRSPSHQVTSIIVATTRPETMLGDTAVAVNPKDKRYKKFIGQTVIVPLINREIKIIADDMVDMKFGTGAVKVTPAHDPNDYILGKRHSLEFVNIMNPDGILNANAGEYSGMDRFEAREVIIEDLKEKKLLEKIEPHSLSAGHCYRCHTIIEPYLSRQWFVKMKPLAKPAIDAVKKGRIKFYPSRWTKVYLNWMENIQDWCISRQIWWGHRLPVYYCKNCQAGKSQIPNPKSQTNSKSQISNFKQKIGIIVSRVKPEKCPDCGSTDIYQDEDVLDTWFSSWLWPFATFKDEVDLKYFYPTSALITAQEIIFFWVARMIMAGLEFQKNIPFKDVYIHGTVRDDTGKKMSKSLGNIIDPLEIIEEFGADALRFSIISITAVGQDIFLSKQKFELGRNFANKIWNASRFIITNLKPEYVKLDLCVSYSSPEMNPAPLNIQNKENNKRCGMNLADKWILSRFYQTLQKIEEAIDNYRFNEAARLMYEFFWHEFCDWYIEFSKPYINEAHTQIVLYKVLEKSLRVLHPFMPFITEEIWQSLHQKIRTSEHQGISIMTEPWPHVQKQMINKKIDAEMHLLIDLIVAIRNVRQVIRVPPASKIEIIFATKIKDKLSVIEKNQVYFKTLANLENIKFKSELKEDIRECASGIAGGINFYIPLSGLIDVAEEKRRLNTKIHELMNREAAIEVKLRNKDFRNKAPKEVVDKEKQKRESIRETIVELKKNLKMLK